MGDLFISLIKHQPSIKEMKKIKINILIICSIVNHYSKFQLTLPQHRFPYEVWPDSSFALRRTSPEICIGA